MSRERRLGHGLGHVCELDGGLPSAVAEAAEVRAGIRGDVRASRLPACLTGPRLPALLPARLPAGPGGANGGAAVSGAVGRALAHLARPHLPHLAAISAHLAAISPHLAAISRHLSPHLSRHLSPLCRPPRHDQPIALPWSIGGIPLLVGQCKLRNQVQVESTVVSFSQSGFETRCYQARLSSLHRPSWCRLIVCSLRSSDRRH